MTDARQGPPLIVPSVLPARLDQVTARDREHIGCAR